MDASEVVLPRTRPATEWIDGVAVRKTSQARAARDARRRCDRRLSRGHGQCGVEWRFRPQPPRGRRGPLVPDVARFSNRLFFAIRRCPVSLDLTAFFASLDLPV